MTVYKYPLNLTDWQLLELPMGAKPLSAQNQDGQLTLWALVDPTRPKQTQRIWIVGTGHPIPNEDWRFLDTVQMGMFVWHVFVEAQ